MTRSSFLAIATLLLLLAYGIWRNHRTDEPSDTEAATVASESDEVDRTTLAEARSGFATRIVTQEGFTPVGPAETPPTGVLDRITYPSAHGPLAAYITPRPAEGRHPAVVWAHGGAGGIASWLWEPVDPDDDQSGAAFREAGFVVMYPSWRGENDNPGKYEMFYGEVDDLLAARDYLATLPWVDPDRIYLVGHSTGATLVLLAATATDRFRAAFALGPWIGLPHDPDDLRDVRLMGRIAVPFDVENPDEVVLRSAFSFAQAIRRPTFVIEGEAHWLPAMPQMIEHARAADAPFYALQVRGGDHFTILHSVTRLIAERIRADVGPTCNIAITEADVAAAFARRRVSADGTPGADAE